MITMMMMTGGARNRRPFYLGAVSAFVSFPNCQQSGAEGLPPPSRTFLLPFLPEPDLSRETGFEEVGRIGTVKSASRKKLGWHLQRIAGG